MSLEKGKFIDDSLMVRAVGFLRGGACVGGSLTRRASVQPIKASHVIHGSPHVT